MLNGLHFGQSRSSDGNLLHAGGDFDADKAIVPTDSLSRQALEAQAKDMAIEDALYALDKALQHGTITSEAYLKQVRRYSPLSSSYWTMASFFPDRIYFM